MLSLLREPCESRSEMNDIIFIVLLACACILGGIPLKLERWKLYLDDFLVGIAYPCAIDGVYFGLSLNHVRVPERS